MNYDDIKVFSLKDIELEAYVHSVYDGDTITTIFPFPGTQNNYKWKCRLSNIDTPEIRSKDEKEKIKAKEIRDILKSKILNKTVKLKCGKMDKYGRILVDVYLDDQECINDWLLNNGYAQKYNGKVFKNKKQF